MQKIVNFTSVIIAGLIIAALIVADKNVGMVLGAIATGLTVFMFVLSADFRGMF